MTTEGFRALYDQGISQAAVKTLPADLDTPVSAALKLLDGEDYSFVLESVEGGNTRGRYSFLGWAPDLLWRCEDGVASHAEPASDFNSIPGDPLKALQAAIDEAKIDEAGLGGVPVPGLVGYLGYDMIRQVEHLPDRPPAGLDMPDALLMRPTMLAVFDTVKDELSIIAVVRPQAGRSADEAWADAQTRLVEAIERLSTELPRAAVKDDTQTALDVQVSPSRADFCEQVNTAKKLIAQGDIFQVVLSRRFEMTYTQDSFTFYRSLRRLNPAPFLFHLKLGDASLIGSSPEILVRARAGTVTVRPIAGTRPRGETSAHDLAMEKNLLADQKERAEHLMLLDLGRNDVGRVAKGGTVTVTDQFQIERYSHVMHIVSNVEGDLRDECSVTDALFAGFPAGTVSGAPKVRAMEIIDSLEQSARGPYAGAVGYFGSNGDMDSCIVLRTAVLKDGTLYVQAGAGIVADSDPMSEAMECEHKAQAIISAAQRA